MHEESPERLHFSENSDLKVEDTRIHAIPVGNESLEPKSTPLDSALS